jgi:hypothetical protein
LKRKKINRDVVELINTDDFVPSEHILRKIDKAVAFERIYTMVEPVYCEDNAKSAVDWVVLFKLVLLQRLYDLPSLRRTVEEVEMNVAYRWFLGYTMSEKTPRFKAVTFDVLHRFTPENIEKIVTWVLDETNKAGFYKISAAFTGTPGNNNVHFTTRKKEQIAAAAKVYTKQLLDELSGGR